MRLREMPTGRKAGDLTHQSAPCTASRTPPSGRRPSRPGHRLPAPRLVAVRRRPISGEQEEAAA